MRAATQTVSAQGEPWTREQQAAFVAGCLSIVEDLRGLEQDMVRVAVSTGALTERQMVLTEFEHPIYPAIQRGDMRDLRRFVRAIRNRLEAMAAEEEQALRETI